MAETAAKAVHPQGEKQVTRAVLKPPDAIFLDNANIGRCLLGEGGYGSNAQSEQ